MRAEEGGTFAINDNNEELSIVGGNTFEDMSELNRVGPLIQSSVDEK